MDKKQVRSTDKQSGGITDKHDKNAGSGAFNQGTEQDPDFNNPLDAEQVRQPEKREDWGNVGKSNAGGFEQGSEEEEDNRQ